MWYYYYLCCSKRLPSHLQELIHRFPYTTINILYKKVNCKDIEVLLSTIYKQSHERIEIIINILRKAPLSSQEILLSKEIRLLKAFIKIDMIYLQDVEENTEKYLSKLK